MTQSSIGSSAVSSDARPIRIVHIQLLPLLTGAQRVSIDILSNLDPGRYDRHVIANGNGPFLDAARRIGCHTHICPSLVRPIRPWSDFSAYRELRDMLARLEIRIVHTHSSKPGFLGRLAAKAAGVKAIVHTVHGYPFDETTRWPWKSIYVAAERKAGKYADRLVVVNEEEREKAVRYRLCDPGKIVKITNGTPDAERDYGANHSRLLELTGFPPDSKITGLVGRLWDQKNVRMFLRAAKLTLNQVPAAKFVLIGDGPDLPALKLYAGELKVLNAVSFAGWRNDARELMGGLDVFAQTSLWEGCSLSMLEAMARGLPIVSTNVRGVKELVSDGDTGLMAELGDADAFAASMVRLLTDSEYANKLGSAAKARQRKEFSFSAYIGAYLKLYQELAG
jgi:glycosyltransferase involved in cell wall biosynthesis